jgi:hypothetical protein
MQLLQPLSSRACGIFCRFAGLILASSVAQNEGFGAHNANDVCADILQAASQLLFRLMMPLRSPNSIAAITEKGKVEEQLQGAHQPADADGLCAL